MKVIGAVPKAAIGYYRTSTLTNADGDSVYRQDRAAHQWASTNGTSITVCFWDAGVSGTDMIEARPGFNAMLRFAAESGIRTVVVEDATRFARDLIALELGLRLCQSIGVRIVTASGQDLCDDQSPERVMSRQLAGVIAHYDRAKTVQRLRMAREAKKAATGKCEGRKSWAEMNPELVKHAKRLARRNPKTGKTRSLRDIAAELEALGYRATNGNRLSAQSVASMLNR